MLSCHTTLSSLVLSSYFLSVRAPYLGSDCHVLTNDLHSVMLNALLALLNSRDALRDKNASQPVSIQLSRLVNGQSSTSDGAHTVRALGQAHKDQV